MFGIQTFHWFPPKLFLELDINIGAIYVFVWIAYFTCIYILSFTFSPTFLGKDCVVITLSIPIISVHVNECFIYIHSRSMKDNLSLHAYSKTCSLIQLTVETENQSLMSINYIKIILKSKYSWALF